MIREGELHPVGVILPLHGSAVELSLFLYGLPDKVDCLLNSVFVHALLSLLSVLLVKAQTQTVVYIGLLQSDSSHVRLSQILSDS